MSEPRIRRVAVLMQEAYGGRAIGEALTRAMECRSDGNKVTSDFWKAVAVAIAASDATTAGPAQTPGNDRAIALFGRREGFQVKSKTGRRRPVRRHA